MPGETPKSFSRVPSLASKPHLPEVSPARLEPAAELAALEGDLEDARAKYAGRTLAREALEELENRISKVSQTAPAELRAKYDLVQASLLTLKGRLLTRTDASTAMEAFQQAVHLFEQHAADLGERKSSTRFLTDWGITLHRIGRNDESIAILSKVCEDGVAPAEAFGYLGFAEFARGHLQDARRALEKGLDIAPADLTMSFYLAQILEHTARQIDATKGPEGAAQARAAAAEAYCRAGDIAWNRGDLRSAGRDGLRALRLEPRSTRAVYLAATSFRLLQHYKLALLIVARFLKNQPEDAEGGYPEHPDALGMKGVLLRELGEVSESVRVLRSIPVDSSELAWVRAQLAVSLSMEGYASLDEALQAAREAVSLNPNDPSFYTILGLLQVTREEYNDAAASLALARKLGNKSEEVDFNLGWALAFSGRCAEAEEILKLVVAANPRAAGAHFALGVCAERAGKLDLAVAYYRKASRLVPEDPTVFIQFIDLLGQQDLREQAMDEIDSRLSGPLAYLALWYRAKFEIYDALWSRALATLRRAFHAAKQAQVDQQLPGILVDCGDVLRQRGDYQLAKVAYGYAYKLEPLRRDVVFGKALCDCEVAEFEDARICLEKALKSSEDNASQSDLWNLHGWAMQHLGEPAAALQSYRRAFKLSGEKDPWYRKGLANMLVNFDVKEAKRQFQAILDEQKYRPDSAPVPEQPSGDTSTVRLLGWCNYRLGYYDEAVRLIESVAERAADQQSAHFDLGLVYLASGRLPLAKEAYSRGYELTRKCQILQQRGVLYIALFDLADGRKHGLLGPDSDEILEWMKRWLASSGVALEKLSWLGFAEQRASL
jgi:tetratricopeptide (TPR) repeat protein